jgi:RNA polymerase sigma-70 factor (ECF subfamily)
MDMSDTDLKAVEACRAGSVDAFGELVRSNQDAVFNLAWRMTGNWHEAADITQETFIQAFRKLHQYRAEYAFKNWVMSIGANLTKNRFRSFSRRKRTEEMAAEWQDIESTPPPESRDEELDAALKQLPGILREALVLKHMEGMSYEDVAVSLGIGVSAAKMRVARGRDELVRLLESKQVQV